MNLLWPGRLLLISSVLLFGCSTIQEEVVQEGMTCLEYIDQEYRLPLESYYSLCYTDTTQQLCDQRNTLDCLDFVGDYCYYKTYSAQTHLIAMCYEEILDQALEEKEIKDNSTHLYLKEEAI